MKHHHAENATNGKLRPEIAAQEKVVSQMPEDHAARVLFQRTGQRGFYILFLAFCTFVFAGCEEPAASRARESATGESKKSTPASESEQLLVSLFPDGGSSFELNVGRGEVLSLAFSPTDPYLVMGCEDGTAVIYDLLTQKPKHTLEPSRHADRFGVKNHFVERLILTKDGRTLATLGWYANFWDIASGEHQGKLETGFAVRALTFSADGEQFAESCWGARIWKTSSKEKTGDTIGTGYAVKKLAFDPDGESLYVLGRKHRFEKGEKPASRRTFLERWSVDHGELLNRWDAEGYDLTAWDLSPDGRLLALCSGEGILLLDAKSFKQAGHLGPSDLEHRVGYDSISATFAPDGKTFCVRDRKGVLHVWDLASKEPLGTLRHGVNNFGSEGMFAYSPDSQLLANTYAARARPGAGLHFFLDVWRVATQERIAHSELAQAGRYVDYTGNAIQLPLAFSPDGELLAVAAGQDGTVKILSTLRALKKD